MSEHDKTNPSVMLDNLVLNTLEQQHAHSRTTSSKIAERNLVELARKLNIRPRCRHCDHNEDNFQRLFFCRGCNYSFHGQCFILYEEHDEENLKYRPRCKAETDLRTHVLVTNLHTSRTQEAELLHEHQNDRGHRWVGVPEVIGDHAATPELLFYGALTKQFATGETTRCLPGLPRRQFPRLISFFGDTGIGKSTIIKNLIRLLAISKPLEMQEMLQVPVVGSSLETENSTSGGIHVYTDPITIATPRPIVYADCEGLKGDSAPVANRLEARLRRAMSIRESTVHGLGRIASRVVPGSSRNGSQAEGEAIPMSIASMPLPWHVNSNHWQSDVVEKIYPRFLYIFSDVVCYVSGNSRTGEHDMEQLIDWARNAHDSTSNQGVKPALLYIINQDVHADLEKWADVQAATEKVFAKLRGSDRFLKEQNLWKAQGQRIESAYQLLLCYYSSVKAVFIPQFLPENPNCEAKDMERQYNKLYEQIDRLSLSSSENREEAGVLFDLETMARHSMGVLERLANDFNSSVDLHSLAEPFQAYPTNFKAHVLNFISRVHERLPIDNSTNHQHIGSEGPCIQNMLKYVTLCIVGEIERTPRDRGSQPELVLSYVQKWKEILEEFYKNQCRCEEISRGMRCLNYKMAHTKGHQFDILGPDRIKSGSFRSSFPQAADRLYEDFSTQLPALLKRMNEETITVWKRSLKEEAVVTGVVNILSNMSCLTCLSKTPIYLLPCNHCICENCARTYDSTRGKEYHILVFPRCPLGCQWRDSEWRIMRKPSEAGVRILSLDGGGVRGIIELAVLQSIMDKVGHGIPIQELFDLVVGTSTGGIIALGIFKRGWSVNEAMRNFEAMVKRAFSKRYLLKWIADVPLARLAAQMICTYLYQNDGIEGALQYAFTDNVKLFGDVILDQPEQCKIALVATSHEEERPVLLTNYNREWGINGDEHNNLRREDKPEHELKVWEAARCTSAAPTYFQQYRHAATGRVYIDGGMEKNNPVSIADSERKFIWPNKSENTRDIIISIGTGIRTDYRGEALLKAPGLSHMLKPLERLGLVAKIATLRLVLYNTTNCQKIWNEYRHSLGPDESLVSKCHRLNVPFGLGQDLGSLDAVSKMDAMKEEALRFLEQRSESTDPDLQREEYEKLELVARQLVASLFYFQVLEITHYSDDEDVCHGLLRCRLSPSCEAQMQSLIQARPVFRLYEGVGGAGDFTNVALNGRGWNLPSFSTRAEFRMPKSYTDVRIRISFGVYWDDISGFPRRLTGETSST